jgi:hypothetical protein
MGVDQRARNLWVQADCRISEKISFGAMISLGLLICMIGFCLSHQVDFDF